MTMLQMPSASAASAATTASADASVPAAGACATPDRERLNRREPNTAACLPRLGDGSSHLDRFVTILQCAQKRPFTPAALRDMKHKAFDRHNARGEFIPGNGSGPMGVWIQIGSKVLVDLDALDRWIVAHALKPDDPGRGHRTRASRIQGLRGRT
jgi:hypothetical protein